ncbi:MAG: Crp/Fnr family transcriptional regulator [Pseudomonadota bacterium]|nr:Crp/Fnr family transcriptional regulator [Pseudomonadota bacterium]
MNSAAREETFVPLLSDFPLFRGLNGEQLRFLAAECFPRSASKGFVVCEKGSFLEGFFAVRKGRVKLAVLTAEGAERVVQIVLPGDTFGEAVGLLDRPSPVYAQALCDSELLFFRADRVRAAVTRWPALGFLFLEKACERVYALYRDLEACCLQSALQRVAGFLLDNLSCGRGRLLEGAPQVVLPAGKAVVASRLNLTPETFSRELRHLVGEGVISVDRSVVHVHAPDRLQAAAAQD